MAASVQNLSCRLYYVMEEIGASESMRQLARKSAISTEILDLIGLSDSFRYYICGSRFEGSAVLDTLSDVDIISHLIHSFVNLEQDDLQGAKLLLIRDEYTHPGYVKLQNVQYNQPLTIQTLLRQVKDKTRIYLGLILHNRDIDCMGRICLKPPPDKNKNGPATKVVNERGVHMCDIVFAVFCPRIPDFANIWTRRRKRFEWPTDKQIRDMSGMGCLVVQVGYECSAESGMEWRMSFTRQERLLMSSLNPTQHKVYILLKIIRKEQLKPLFGDKLISSYHLKTLVLHVIENSPSAFWSMDNMVNCIMQCLHTLCSWVRCGFCPNYFIKENNMFSKSLYRHKRFALMKKLKELLHLEQNIFFRLSTSGIGSMLTDVGHISGNNEAKINASLLKIHLSFYPYSDLMLLEYTDERTRRIRGVSLLEYLYSTTAVPGYTETETSTLFAYIVPWVHLNFAKQLANDSLQKSREPGDYQSIYGAFEHFKKASPTDMVQVHLAKASYYFMKRGFEDCLTLLNQVENNLNKTSTISPCFCLQGELHFDRRQAMTTVVTMPREEIAARIAGCVIFLPSHKRLVPLALRLEMERTKHNARSTEDLYEQMQQETFECARVDATVYLYFLKYLVSKELDKTYQSLSALKLLRRVISTRNIGHRGTAYNLLGWIYIQEDRVGEAIQCFAESWRIRPNNNAARIHMKRLSGILCRIISNWKKPHLH